jgi:hypothetical protein
VLAPRGDKGFDSVSSVGQVRLLQPIHEEPRAPEPVSPPPSAGLPKQTNKSTDQQTNKPTNQQTNKQRETIVSIAENIRYHFAFRLRDAAVVSLRDPVGKGGAVSCIEQRQMAAKHSSRHMNDAWKNTACVHSNLHTCCHTFIHAYIQSTSFLSHLIHTRPSCG